VGKELIILVVVLLLAIGLGIFFMGFAQPY
jgi:hypothetical protein